MNPPRSIVLLLALLSFAVSGCSGSIKPSADAVQRRSVTEAPDVAGADPSVGERQNNAGPAPGRTLRAALAFPTRIDGTAEIAEPILRLGQVEHVAEFVVNVATDLSCADVAYTMRVPPNRDVDLGMVRDGSYHICVDGLDSNGRALASTAASIAFVRRSAPPEPFSVLGPNGLVTVASFELRWTPSKGAKTYDVLVSTSETCAGEKAETRLEGLAGETTTLTLPAEATSGPRSLCLVANDDAGNKRHASGAFTFVAGTSAQPLPIAILTNLPSDGTSTPAVDVTVKGDGVTSYRHKIGPASVTDCAIKGGFGSVRPVSSALQESLATAPNGSYRLCVLAQNASGMEQDVATMATWTLARLPPTAILSGAPNGLTRDLALNVTVSGSAVAAYRYKLGLASSTDCAVQTDYGGPFPVSAMIDETVASNLNGSIRLCVLAQDSVGTEQAIPTATSWDLDRAPPSAPTAIVAAPAPSELSVSWTGSGSDAVGYLVVRRTGNGVTWAPVDGLSYLLGDVGDGQHFVDFAGASTSVTKSGLLNDTFYHYAVYAFDAAQNYSVATTTIGVPQLDKAWPAMELLAHSASPIIATYNSQDSAGVVTLFAMGQIGSQATFDATRYVPGQGWDPPISIDVDSTFPGTSPTFRSDALGNVFAYYHVLRLVPTFQYSMGVITYKAGTGWSPITTFDAPDTSPLSNSYEVFPDGAGNALMLWANQELDGGTGTHVLKANHYDSTNGWGPTQTIATPTTELLWASNRQVKYDASGNALAVWLASDGTRKNVVSNRYVAGTGWSGLANVEAGSDSAMTTPLLFFTSPADATALWTADGGASCGSVWASQFVATSGWNAGAAAPIESNAACASSLWAVQSADRSVIALWLETTGSDKDLVAARFVPGTGWSVAAPLYAGAESVTSFTATLGSSGQVLVSFGTTNGATTSLHAARFAPGSGWDAELALESRSDPVDLTSLKILPSTQGRFELIWIAAEMGVNNIWHGTFAADGAWSGAALLEHVSESVVAAAHRAGLDAQGHLVVTWLTNDGTRNNLWANTRFAGGAWGTDTALETSSDSMPTFYFMTVNANGNAAVAWQLTDGTRDNLWATNYAIGAGWTPPQTIESHTTSPSYFRLHAAPDSRIIGTWIHSGDVYTAVFGP